MSHKTFLMTLIICMISTHATSASDQYRLTSLLAMQSHATDAVDSALSVLKDLKKVNSESQSNAQFLDSAQQEECAETSTQLEIIIDENRRIAEEATSHKEFLESEIDNAKEYIDYLSGRMKSIYDKRQQLEEQRCASNAFFIRALKEHSDGCGVIELLKKDIEPFTSSNQEEVSFSQVKSISGKLSAYSHLFNEQAVKAFNQISKDDSLDWNSNADDNSREGISLESAYDGSQARNTKVAAGDKLMALLDRLQGHLKESTEALTKNEIQSSWDLVGWLGLSENELEYLQSEQSRKETYLNKLIVSQQAAIAHEETSWRIHQESVNVLETLNRDCEAKHEFFEAETQRRNDENDILKDIFSIFEDKVATISTDIRNKIDQHSDADNDT